MNQEPDWASPPGDTIARLMEVKEIGADEMAEAMSISASDFSALIQGCYRINLEMAQVLADNLGSSARFWIARDKSYVRDLVRIGEASETLISDWLKSMPIASMRKFGIIKKGIRSNETLLNDLLKFFGCRNLQEWGTRYSTGVGAVAFRTSTAFPTDDMATLVWLRLGEQLAELQRVNIYNRSLFQNMLPSLKRLSAFKRPSIFLERLTSACAEVGVHVTTARAPDGCRASGASWIHADGNPIVHLSFRHLSEDHFWFTFFHEAAHIILHEREHIDDDFGVGNSVELEDYEREANAYSHDILLSEPLKAQLLAGGRPTPSAIRRFAREAGVTPGIIVGILENDGVIPYGRLSSMKRRYTWGADLHIPDIKD